MRDRIIASASCCATATIWVRFAVFMPWYEHGII